MQVPGGEIGEVQKNFPYLWLWFEETHLDESWSKFNQKLLDIPGRLHQFRIGVPRWFQVLMAKPWAVVVATVRDLYHRPQPGEIRLQCSHHLD